MKRKPIGRESLEALVRMHQAELYRYLRYLGANPGDAEDLVQEAFLTVLREGIAPDALDERREAAWVRGVARNLFLRHCRRRQVSGTDEASLDRAEQVWTAEFLRDGDGFDYVEALHRCLAELTSEQRRALNLRYAERKSREEMAGLLSMTENGVKSLLQRIRARLAECVQNRLAWETKA